MSLGLKWSTCFKSSYVSSHSSFNKASFLGSPYLSRDEALALYERRDILSDTEIYAIEEEVRDSLIDLQRREGAAVEDLDRKWKEFPECEINS